MLSVFYDVFAVIDGQTVDISRTGLEFFAAFHAFRRYLDRIADIRDKHIRFLHSDFFC